MYEMKTSKNYVGRRDQFFEKSSEETKRGGDRELKSCRDDEIFPF